jgi:hypothetical protein
MEIAYLTTILPALTAEPASIVYIVTGAVTLLFARRRTAGQQAADSSVAMLFCRKQTHDKLSKLKLV